MDRGAWQAAVHAVAKSQTRLSASVSLFTSVHWRRKWKPTPVFLPGESQGQRSLVGFCLQGRTESDTTDATQQQQHRFSILSLRNNIILKFLHSKIRHKRINAVVLLLTCVRLCDPMDYSTPRLPVLHYLPDFAQTHAH